MLDKIKTIYTWIDGLNTNLKTLIIVILVVIVSQNVFVSQTEKVLIDQYKKEKIAKKLSQDYTKKITPEIGRCLQTILDKDSQASNILLLNYHNTLQSNQGLSYLYITALIEKRTGLNSQSCIREWRELEYMNYGEEFDHINNNNLLRVDNIKDFEKSFPNITDLIKRSKVKAAAFYPIKIKNKPLGMLVLLYSTPRDSWKEYYPKYLAESVIEIAGYLDYESYLKKQ